MTDLLPELSSTLMTPTSADTYRPLRNILAICFFGLLFTACNRDDSKEEAQLPEWIEALPYNIELSKVPGVSIVQVEPSPGEGRMISTDSFEWKSAKAEYAFLGSAIISWCDFEGVISIDADLPENRRYNISIDAPEGATIFPLAQTAFESVFQLEYKEAIETHQVWVLQKTADARKMLVPVDSENSNWGTAQTSGGFGYDFRAGSMKDLAEILSKYLEGGLVFDETGLDGFYRFELAMNHWEPETALPALEPLGLRAVLIDRDLPTLRIDYAEPPGVDPAR